MDIQEKIIESINKHHNFSMKKECVEEILNILKQHCPKCNPCKCCLCKCNPCKCNPCKCCSCKSKSCKCNPCKCCSCKC